MTWGNNYSRQRDDPEQPPAPGQPTANPGNADGQRTSCWAATRRWVASCCRRQSAPEQPNPTPGQETDDGQQPTDGQQPVDVQPTAGKYTIHIKPAYNRIKYH